MKNLTLLISVSLLCGYAHNIKAQSYIKINASFYSEKLDTVKKIGIYLPIDYYVNTEQHYATIYYLHSAGGNQNEGNTDAMWYYNMHSQDTTITSPPAIFVCPDGSSQPYLGSCWMNSTLYGSYEDYFIQDVIGFIESNFKAIPHKNFRSLVGWSMGGYGSARLCVRYPEMFRASVPCIGFMAMPDTILNNWKQLYYLENSSYVPTINNGPNTQLWLTMCGGLSPNLANPPCYVDFPFDTLGNWVDTVLNRWYENDLSRKVKNLPDENELSWFLVCGTQDYMATYPAYEVFMDSLNYYGIGYNYNFFDGGHVWNKESWMMAIHWLDSIFNLSYKTMGIPVYESGLSHFDLFPNPASDHVTISYHLKEREMVQVSFFDIYGKQMGKGKNEFQSAGEYQLTWDVSAYPPGIYFCCLKSENKKVTRKIIKIK